MHQASVMTVFADVESAERMGCGPGYRRYLVALRDAETRALAEAADAVARHPRAYANEEPVVPRTPMGIRHLSELIWQDTLGVSEVWWFTDQSSQCFHSRGVPTGVPIRAFTCRHMHPDQMLMARLRSASEMEALIRQIGMWVMTCHWLAFDSIGARAFADVEVSPDAPLRLLEGVAVREDMPNLFLGADLAPAWRYTVTQEYFHYDTGDPFFTLPDTDAAAFERALRDHARRQDRSYCQVPFTKDRLVSFITDGTVIVPSPEAS